MKKYKVSEFFKKKRLKMRNKVNKPSAKLTRENRRHKLMKLVMKGETLQQITMKFQRLLGCSLNNHFQ